MITITEARHTQRTSGLKFDLALYEKDPVFSSNYSKTPERPTREHASGAPQILFTDILGTIVEHLYLSQCVEVRFTGAEEDQVEQHGQRTIDEASRDSDVKQGDTAEEADQEADSSEQTSLWSLTVATVFVRSRNGSRRDRDHHPRRHLVSNLRCHKYASFT